MAKIKLGLRNLSAHATVTKCNTIISCMTDNASFPNPTPSLAQLQTLSTELETAIAEAMSRDYFKVSVKKEKHKITLKALAHLGAYVQSVSDDALVIESSGFEVVKKGSPSGVLPAPGNLHAFPMNGFPGCILLKWQHVKGGTKGYFVEMTTGNPTLPATEWTIAACCTKSKIKIEGLKPLTYYYFRVKAFGTSGMGASSPAISGVAF